MVCSLLHAVMFVLNVSIVMNIHIIGLFGHFTKLAESSVGLSGELLDEAIGLLIFLDRNYSSLNMWMLLAS